MQKNEVNKGGKFKLSWSLGMKISSQAFFLLKQKNERKKKNQDLTKCVEYVLLSL